MVNPLNAGDEYSHHLEHCFVGQCLAALNKRLIASLLAVPNHQNSGNFYSLQAENYCCNSQLEENENFKLKSQHIKG